MEESDLAVYDYLVWAAFKDGLMSLLYPNGRSQAAHDHFVASGLERWRKHPDKVKMMKVIDTDLPDSGPFGNIVGVAKWLFYPRDRTEAEIEAEEKEVKEEPDPPDMNLELRNHFFGTMMRFKKEIMGTKGHIMLQVLATLPEHHRRGIGGMHLAWGAEKADELGLQSYLEASPAGRPLYERMGFERVRDIPFDAREWGMDRDMPHVCMVRPVKAAANGNTI